MAGESKVTTDHKTIQKWIEDRGGKPVTIKRTGKGDDPGMLRVDFPNYGRERDQDTFEEVSWDDFFRKFDEKDLAFLYQDEMKSGEPSRFFKFVSRDTAEHKEDRQREPEKRRQEDKKK